MNKYFYLAVLYVIIGLTLTRTEGNILSFFGFGHSSAARNAASISANPATGQTFLNLSLAVIKNIEANPAYNAVLQSESANFVAYLNNTANQALISSNCTVFITGLKAAKAADEANEHTREKIHSDIQKQFRQAAHNATGSNRKNELDSSEED